MTALAPRAARLRWIAYAAMIACTVFDIALAPFAPFDPLANHALRRTLAAAVGFGLGAAVLAYVTPRVEAELTLPWLAPALRVAIAASEIAMFYGWLPVAISIAGQLVLPWSRPLADPWLAALDEVAGLAHPHTYTALDAAGALGPLRLAYDSVAWQLPLAVVFVVLVRRDVERAWEYVAVVAVAGVASIPMMWAAPAVGPRAWYGSDAYPNPPVELRTVAELLALRAGQAPDVDEVHGLLTFPSFHVVFGLLLARTLRGYGVWSVVILGWNLVVAISAVPIGSHYVADIVAGALWTVAAAWGVERIATSPNGEGVGAGG